MNAATGDGEGGNGSDGNSGGGSNGGNNGGDGNADGGTGSDGNGDGNGDGSGDGSGDGTSTPGERPATCEAGQTQGNTVLIIGDSYCDINSKAFGTELQRLAREAGSLGDSDKYLDRSVSGAQMAAASLIAKDIPGQYADENNSDGHVKTVVMDGGGNDILIGNRGCITNQAPPENQSCVDTINTAMDAAKKLLAKMASDGVENVVYFFYPYLPGGGLGGDKALEKQSLDYAYPVVKKACEDAQGLTCTFVDTRGSIGEDPSDFQDGIHPTVPNIQKISAVVWGAMMQQCVAQ